MNISGKYRWVVTYVPWFVAAVVLMIDPRHIDELAVRHRDWTGIITAVWTALVAWANRTKAAEKLR